MFHPTCRHATQWPSRNMAIVWCLLWIGINAVNSEYGLSYCVYKVNEAIWNWIKCFIYGISTMLNINFPVIWYLEIFDCRWNAVLSISRPPMYILVQSCAVCIFHYSNSDISISMDLSRLPEPSWQQLLNRYIYIYIYTYICCETMYRILLPLNIGGYVIYLIPR